MGVKGQIEVILGKWAEAFGARELHGVAQLYTDDAMFIGAEGTAGRGREAIVEYLDAHWTDATITFHDLNVELLGRDVAIAALKGSATPQEGALPRAFRFLQTYVWTGQGWRIAGHHSSYEPEAAG